MQEKYMTLSAGHYETNCIRVEMTTLPEALAQYSEDLGIGVYKPPGEVVTNDEFGIFIDDLPATPDFAAAITQYQGEESSIKLPWDTPRIQVKIRGTQYPLLSRNKCQEFYTAWHGIGLVTLSGIRVQLIVGSNSGVAYAGKDTNGRHNHVTNFIVTIRRD